MSFSRGRFTDCLKTIHYTSIKKQTERLFPSPSQQSQPASEMSTSCSALVLGLARTFPSLFSQGQAPGSLCNLPCLCPLGLSRLPVPWALPSTATNNPRSCCLALLTSATPVRQLSVFPNSGCYASWLKGALVSFGSLESHCPGAQL